MKKIILYLSGMFLLLFFILALRPVPTIPEQECKVTTGVVTDLFEAGENDIVFRLQGDVRNFYINRGLERGLSLSGLEEMLNGNRVTIKYPKYWTPLDPTRQTIHLAKVECGGRTIYSETD